MKFNSMVQYHSGKLIGTYGTRRVFSKRLITMMKNLRVYENYHNAIKCMAKIAEKIDNYEG